MITIRIRTKRRGVKFVAAVLAGAAVVVAAALTVAYDGRANVANVVAGSGDAPANTTFSQPAGPAMTMGATATETTPPSAPAVAVAKPTITAVA
ncbi:MAG: hypothetical protein QOC63_6201 [Mycobacterium sp.]|jgi:hypothetical protein|nr:hypothetical protein [Mycobacterium sp.]